MCSLVRNALIKTVRLLPVHIADTVFFFISVLLTGFEDGGVVALLAKPASPVRVRLSNDGHHANVRGVSTPPQENRKKHTAKHCTKGGFTAWCKDSPTKVRKKHPLTNSNMLAPPSVPVLISYRIFLLGSMFAKRDSAGRK